MLKQNTNPMHLSIPYSLKWVGIIGGAWAIIIAVGTVITYLPGHPDFSPLTTYLSDMSDTPGWPQIIFSFGLVPTTLMILWVLLFTALWPIAG